MRLTFGRPILKLMAGLQSGYAADCKSAYAGSIPASASNASLELSGQGTDETLDDAIVEVVDLCNKLELPGYWGSDKSASADGTKWSVYEQNGIPPPPKGFEAMSHRNRLRPNLVAAGLTTAIAAFMWAPSALAQSSDASDDHGQWSVGLAAVGLDKPYADYDTETYVFPLVSYESRWISASVPKFDIKLNSSETLSFRLRASVAGDGYDAKDSPLLTGMKDRKFSLWAGGAVVWNADFANFTGEVLTDAGGKSKGTSAKLQMDRRFAAGNFGFTPRLAAEWVDDKYVDYYYGVKQSEVLVDRPFYEGKATTNAQVGLTLDYNPAEHHTVFLDAGFTRYGSTVEDSPLVDKPNQTTLGLGYSYRF